MTREELIRKCVLVAGEIILSSDPTSGAYLKEGRGNFVTAADLASEKSTIDLIHEQFPDDNILSEETNAELANPLEVDNLWVIDPIDGTNNFRFSRHYSCSSVAYVEKGQILLAAVYNPYTKELFFAEKGKGAFLNNKQITINNASDLSRAFIATDNSNDPEGTKRNLELALKIQPSPTVYIKGSGIMTICELSAGRFDLYFHTTIKPWDNAAAMLIAEEAGAEVVDLQGNSTNFMSQEVIVGNKKLIEQCVVAFSS